MSCCPIHVQTAGRIEREVGTKASKNIVFVGLFNKYLNCRKVSFGLGELEKNCANGATGKVMETFAED